MPALRLQHTSVQVPLRELARCEVFYREVFGLRQVKNLAGIAWFDHWRPKSSEDTMIPPPPV